jgi:lysophospholipase L1-like esterase
MRHAIALLAGLILAAVPAAHGNAMPSSPVHVMLLGDSITAGTSAGVEDRQTIGYRLRLAERLRAGGYAVDLVGSQRTGAMPDPEHEGHPGFTVAALDSRLDDWLSVNPADVVLVMAGTNDAAQGLPGGAGRLAALVDHIAARLPEAAILVSTIPPINPNGGGGSVASAEMAARLNAELPAAIATRQAAGRNVRLVNVGGMLDLSHLDSGGIHPNAAGYARMADLWYDALTPYLSPALASCTPRPPIDVRATPSGAGLLAVDIRARTPIASVRHDRLTNATMTTPSIQGDRAAFTVRRQHPGPSYLAFTVTDACGPWPSFVGGGAAAF